MGLFRPGLRYVDIENKTTKYKERATTDLRVWPMSKFPEGGFKGDLDLDDVWPETAL